MPEAAADSSVTLDPIFVGGTGRSGTTVLGELIGHHSSYEVIPHEARFHAEPRGLPGLLKGNVTIDQFLERMREHYRVDHLGREGGIDRFVEEETFESALEAFPKRFEQDQIGAARDLVRALLDPVAERAGKPGWVEMTPRNIFFARTNLKLFPRMRLIHIRRDGRDTASSLVKRRQARTGDGGDIFDALRWWGDRRLGAIKGTRGFPPDQLLTLELEDLVDRDREGSYERLLAFLELDDDAGMRSFFENEVKPSQANIGRWRQHLEGEEAEREFLELHRSIEESLREQAERSERAAEKRAAKRAAAS